MSKYESFKFNTNAGYIDPNLERTKYDRYRINMTNNSLASTIGYIFITKPQLNFFEPGTNGAKLTKEIQTSFEYDLLLESDTELFRCLQAYQGNTTPFIKPMFKRCKSISNEDVVLDTFESATTTSDWKVVYASGTNKSYQPNTVTLEFTDDRRLTIYKLIYIWIKYMHDIKNGNIKPTAENRIKGFLDYVSTIYYFLTSEDGKSIIYAAQYIGAFPINIPDSSFAWTKGNNQDIDYSIPFQYFKKNTSPSLFKDFQKISPKSGKEFLDMPGDGTIRPTWAGGVYVEKNSRGIYQLHFTE